MTPEDLELTVRLARWMGWREFQGLTEEPAPGTSFATYGAPDTLRISRPDATRTGTIEWLPLTRPDHAAEVMAEAAGRGWHVELHVFGGSGAALVYVYSAQPPGVKPIGQAQAAQWPVAVCLAVLAAAEGVA